MYRGNKLSDPQPGVAEKRMSGMQVGLKTRFFDKLSIHLHSIDWLQRFVFVIAITAGCAGKSKWPLLIVYGQSFNHRPRHLWFHIGYCWFHIIDFFRRGFTQRFGGKK